MYTEFFNLKVKPFELVPDSAFLYQSRSHRNALNYLEFGLHEMAGFILLTGEVGSGKTTIVRNIVSKMGKEVASSMILNTRVTNKQLLAMINYDFGLNVAGKDKVTLLRDLNDFLISIHAQKRRAVILIDEAQNLSVSALEEIRMLSNLEATSVKFLQIVLVGQPELNKTIARDDLRQLRQRIGVHVQIDPLNRTETEDYIYYRLSVAGNRNALTWGDGTFDELYRCSQGIPRLINVFCDFILLAACVESITKLDLEFVQDVLDDVSWDKHLAEHATDDSSKDKVLSQESQEDREQKMAALEALLINSDEINRGLKVQQELLKEMVEIQKNGFIRMEAGMDILYLHLQMYLNCVADKDRPNIKTVDEVLTDMDAERF